MFLRPFSNFWRVWELLPGLPWPRTSWALCANIAFNRNRVEIRHGSSLKIPELLGSFRSSGKCINGNALYVPRLAWLFSEAYRTSRSPVNSNQQIKRRLPNWLLWICCFLPLGQQTVEGLAFAWQVKMQVLYVLHNPHKSKTCKSPGKSGWKFSRTSDFVGKFRKLHVLDFAEHCQTKWSTNHDLIGTVRQNQQSNWEFVGIDVILKTLALLLFCSMLQL